MISPKMKFVDDLIGVTNGSNGFLRIMTEHELIYIADHHLQQNFNENRPGHFENRKLGRGSFDRTHCQTLLKK